MDQPTDELVFLEDDAPVAPKTPEAPHSLGRNDFWKVMIVDDELEVHHVTRLVLGDFKYKGKKLAFINAFSAAEAERLLRENPDTAIVLLDVVMEDNDAGLKLVRYIREELKNHFIRIILRTGQPGQAPEERVIIEYDINDYKEKTELTAQKLLTTIVSSLRTYCDISTIESSRRGLEKIIDASGNIFELQSMEKFTAGVLTQITSLLDLHRNAIYCQASGFAAVNDQGEFYIMAATGDFQRHVRRKVREAVPAEVYDGLMHAVESQTNLLFDGNRYVGYFKSQNGSENIIYLEGGHELTELDRQLIEIFFTNVSIAFDNIYLSKEVEDTQKEIILTLGETIECRSRETGNHVRRVSEYARLLALKLGLSGEEAELLRLASPMHDVGKLAIPDSILNKPSKLEPAEMEIIRSHARIGYDILKGSTHEIMKTAAVIADQHHERWDGTGYPHRLAGEDIHIFGRITAVADVFDALMSDRVYRPAWALERVVAHFREQRGLHFDPRLTDIMLDNLDEFLKIRERYGD